MSKSIPVVLEERLLINELDRKILQTIEYLSPFDTGTLYIEGNDFNVDTPSIKEIAESLSLKCEEVLNSLEHVRSVWKLPPKEQLPTNNGRISPNEALVKAVLNQHKLRFDPEIKDYRVPRVHFYNSELGTGQLYTNTKAFKGEQIFRHAMGYNDIMNSYHIQGGVMPELILMFGKQKNQRALLTGVNEDLAENENEVEYIKFIIENITESDLTSKQLWHIRNNFAKTLDSLYDVAIEASKEIAPLIEDIPTYVPIHIYYSYNDDANLNELEDLLITKLRNIHSNMKDAAEKLPKLHVDLAKDLKDFAITRMTIELANYVLDNIKSKNFEDGKDLKKNIKSLFLDEEEKPLDELNKIKVWLEALYKKIVGNTVYFEDEYTLVINKYLDKKSSVSIGMIESYRINQKKKYQKLEEKVHLLRSNVEELEQFELAYQTEIKEGHSWFTKQIAIKPTEAKIVEMIKKQIYKKYYLDILIPSLERLTGKKHNIKLHTDREITVYVPDPSALLGQNEYDEDLLYGTLITSIPRTNRQRSNEPLLNSTFELQKKHETAVATRLKLNKQKPKRFSEFDKRHTSAFSDVLWTSYGADGFRLQHKMVIAPTMVDGEYEEVPEMVFYLKTPTRHDTKKLGEQLKRGNKGTWAAKRVDKGGPTTGQVMQIRHPDGSDEWFFFDDDFYEEIYDKYGSSIANIKGTINDINNKDEINRQEELLQDIYEDVKVDLKYMLLMNDMHLGSYTFPGRPSNIEVIRSSYDVALQTLGFNKISMLQSSEILHGNLKFKSYDSSYEGFDLDPIKFNKHSILLIEELQKLGYDFEQILKIYMMFSSENYSSRAMFRGKDQKEMFAQLLRPIMIELMNHEIPVFIGSGNHWNSSSKNEDEASAIVSMFESKYADMGLLQHKHTGGQSYSLDVVKLPSNKNTNIQALIAHKMKHGKTEISSIMDQAVGTKQDALFVITADRHHCGMIAEKERFGLLDTGKQSVMPYVMAIGKASSTRGAMAMGYSPNRDLCYSVRFWMDNVVHKIINWEKKSNILKNTHETIKVALRKKYLK